ncbi:MAG: aminoacyl-tRNA hydrolase [Planctomycetota bacterium]
MGLGNPGRGYARTRHNAGFMVLDRLAKAHGGRLSRRAYEGKKCELEIGPYKVMLLKPMTYMNESGRSVEALVRERGLSLDELLVVLDDLALPLGTLRLRREGSSGGHRGIESITSALESDRFARLRIGIGGVSDPGWRDFVLSRFREEEYDALEEALRRACEACETWVNEGIEAAMNAFNARKTSHDRPCASDNDEGPELDGGRRR